MLTFHAAHQCDRERSPRETAEEVGADFAMGAQHRLRRDRRVRLSLLDTPRPRLNY